MCGLITSDIKCVFTFTERQSEKLDMMEDGETNKTWTTAQISHWWSNVQWMLDHQFRKFTYNGWTQTKTKEAWSEVFQTLNDNLKCCSDYKYSFSVAFKIRSLCLCSYHFFHGWGRQQEVWPHAQTTRSEISKPQRLFWRNTASGKANERDLYNSLHWRMWLALYLFFVVCESHTKSCVIHNTQSNIWNLH